MKLFTTNLRAVTFIASLLFFNNIISAQAPNKVNVDYQGSIFSFSENVKEISKSSWPEYSQYNGNFYGWITFKETPDQNTQNSLPKDGINLIYYIGKNTYSFVATKNLSIARLKRYNTLAVNPLVPEMKMSADLKNLTIGDWATDGENISIFLEHTDAISNEDAINHLGAMGMKIKNGYPDYNVIELKIHNTLLYDVAGLNFVQYMEVIPAPSVKEDTNGRGIHKANSLDTQTINGRNYTGKGIGVLVRDDGVVGPHIDFQGRIVNSFTFTTGLTHGDGVAGILAGAGNLNPKNRGMAADAEISVSFYSASFLDSSTNNLINSGVVQITNSSYGQGCNGGYTTVAQRVDQQTIDNSSLLHVFSAGNAGLADCGYGVTGWGTITGGHKLGKNVIAVANVVADGTLAPASSKGPATDGRIKPDITAHGQGQISTSENNSYQTFGGTSGAAPGVAGVAAQLYELYNETYNVLPSSGLIKAIMLNSASDYGHRGPDYSYGWGVLNALRAGEIIENNAFESGMITQGQSISHNINVATGVEQIKIMVYWTDQPAAAGATTALVNDIDLNITAPDSSNHLPWVLDPTPTLNLLDAPAVTGVDHLNNMEQIVINNPMPGNYNINLTGFNIPVGPQGYFLVYDVITSPLRLTYPDNGESFTPGETEIIQWDAVNQNTPFDLEYSIDNGVNWINIATVPAENRLYEWVVPANISGLCKVRVTNNGFSSLSSNVFSIANKPLNIAVTAACPTGLSLSWDQVPNASNYEVYLLGNTTMELVSTTSTNSADILVNDPTEDNWFAVRATGGNGWISERTIAQNYNGGIFNCNDVNNMSILSLDNPGADFQSLCNPGAFQITITIQNNGPQDISNFNLSYQLNNESPVVEPFTQTLNAGAVTNFTFSTPLNITNPGDNSFRVTIDLITDNDQTDNELSFDFFNHDTTNPINVLEDFETNGVFPTGWILSNPDDDITWEEIITVTGSDGNITTAAFLDNSQYIQVNETDSFTTSYYDLKNINTAFLNFDIAKAQWSQDYNDQLTVQISTDCGATFTNIYFKDGLNLATVPYIESSWFPSSAADWRTESIDLTPYIGNDAIIRFSLLNDYSNSTFIDNILISQTLSVNDNLLNTARIYPNPSSDFVTIESEELNGLDIVLYNTLGQKVFQQTMTSGKAVINTSQLSNGVYFIQVKNGLNEGIAKLIVSH